MEGIRKSLQITIENCEFAKEFHYFLTVQLDGEGEKVTIITRITILQRKSTLICHSNLFYSNLTFFQTSNNFCLEEDRCIRSCY